MQTDSAQDHAPSFQGHPATRMRAADYVFESLSRAILSGELAPGSVLATQRELSRQFAVSPLVVRQATHRLEELGLVRVRQGSTTIVLDPTQATDVRLIQLQLELAGAGDDRLALAARENQALCTLPMLALAERRISEEGLLELERLVDTLPDSPTRSEFLTFQLGFWGQIARATRNPLLQQQLRWWAEVVRDIEKRGNTPTSMRAAGLPRSTYRNLIRALRKRRGAVELWHKVLEPLFMWVEGQSGYQSTDTSAKSQPRNGSKQARAAR